MVVKYKKQRYNKLMIKQEESLRLKIDLVLKSLSLEKVTYTINSPDNLLFGDLSINVALVTHPKVKKRYTSALDLAREIVVRLEKEKDIKQTFAQITVEEPGFINLWFSKDYLLAQLEELLKRKENFVRGELKNQKIMIEFAHPNTHKAFHVGHLRNISIGESIVRLLEATGHRVVRANYQGDVGMHIAKAIYSLLYTLPFKDDISKAKNIHERVEFLGKAYAAGSRAFEENEEAKETIRDINYLVYASAQRFWQEKGVKPGSTDYMKFVQERIKEVDKVFDLWKETRQWSLDYFETIYKRVDTHYDRYYFESECLIGVDLAKEAVKKGVLQESEGAIIFDGKPYSLDTRVFVNSLGLPTYEAKELALAEKEFSEFGRLDRVIHVVGPEQSSFFKVTFKAEELLNPDKYKNKQYHLAYGWVRLKHGKMSSRAGNVVLGEWLLDETKAKIKKQFPEMDEETAEKVAVGAVKYSVLRFSTASDISFSFDESISLDGNSGPYLQYTYARTQSILAKTGIRNYELGIGNYELNDEESLLLRIIYHFSDVVGEAAENYAPNLLCNFLFGLAQKFNLFYQKHKVIGSDKEESRLMLVKAVGAIIKNGLYLLGIEAPERM